MGSERCIRDSPSAAKAVVIGCGIVGNSLAYHLSQLGWSDLVLIDKGPLPNPGGSTGHASNFIFLVDHSKEMTQLTRESVRQYKELDVFTECGGIEVARTEERMEELRRRIVYALLAVGVAFLACLYFSPQIFALMQVPIMQALHQHHLDEKLVYLNPT